jgi:hypothetical protein
MNVRGGQIVPGPQYPWSNQSQADRANKEAADIFYSAKASG